MQIVLIGCSKKKHPYVYDPRRGGRVCPEELYAGPLFVKRVEYARRQCCPWFVLSAQFGLWGETEEKNPTFDGVLCRNDGKVYDLRITDLEPADRAAWITTEDVVIVGGMQRQSPTEKLSAMLAACAAMGLAHSVEKRNVERDTLPPEDLCPHCGKMRRHNKGFCSEKCFQEWRRWAK
ncbi:MAG: hypothetical protein E6Q97_30730 [Desulfurellales bacterium]|nr:MAG: hypothetical protein E6Q97_30730 [Desulfurellales bacterium]